MKILLNIVLAAAAVWVSILAPPSAHADDGANAVMHDAALFCRWLDGDSSPQGIMRAVNEFEVQEVPYDNAIGTMTYALAYLCPEYVPAMRYTDAYYNGPRMGV
jgi:hypothetical protein